MSAVYSTRLASNSLLGVGANNLGTVPPLRKWIVKDISAQCPQTFAHALLGFSVYGDSSHAAILSVLSPWVVSGLCYEWHGSQVLESLESLIFSALEGGWAVRVSGYVLTTP